MCACLLGFFGMGFVYNFHAFGSSNFLVARFEGDEFGSQSRIFRKEIEERSRDFGVTSIRPFFDTIESPGEAHAVLLQDSHSMGIVWGSPQWLTVTLAPETIETELAPRINPAFARFGAMRIIDEVPAYGLSFRPQRGSASFIGALLSPSEINLLFAGQMESGWRSNAHRAYPWWRLGNNYLIEALSDRTYQYGAMDCALRAYANSRQLLMPGDNDELLFAIANNSGIARFIQGTIERDKKARASGLKALRIARKGRSKRNSFGIVYKVPHVARENMGLIAKNFIKKKRKSHHAHH